MESILRDASTVELAMVAVAFEAFCRFYPGTKNLIEEQEFHGKEMAFLTRFMQSLRERKMDVIKTSASMLSKARQPRLLTYLLDASMNSLAFIEAFLDYLVELYGQDHGDPSRSVGQVTAYMTAYTVTEIERCNRHGSAAEAFRIIWKAFLGTKYESAFRKTLGHFRWETKIDTLIQ